MAAILVVEDQGELRSRLAAVLVANRHHVTCAADGAEALALLGAGRFDIVITDLRLPEVDGLVLLRHVRKQMPDTAVILMSGSGDMKDAITAMTEQAADFLGKPFEMDKLVSTVERVTRERRGR